MSDQSPQWLQWARELQAMSQTGLAFTDGSYDRQRYERMAEIAAEITAQHSNLSSQEALAGFERQVGYATVKVDVRGAVVRNHKLLLVQERRDQKWCMPGGWADVGDIPSDMVAREVWEESGFKVKPVKLIGIYDANRGPRPMEFFHAFKVIFLCDIISGEPTTSDETMGVDFFDFDNLPPFSGERTKMHHIQELQAHLSDPNRPAWFD